MTGVLVSARAGVVREDNPGPMTLDGTNTWVLAAPGAATGVVVDPGEDEPAHRAAVLAHLAGRGLRCGLVVLTHHHHDHAGGLDAFLAALDHPPRVLRDVETRVDVDGLRLHLLATPGHTADSVCVLLPQEGSLLTGDVVLGRGSTVLAPPAGDDDDPLGDHLASLRRLAALPGVVRLLPGHGPVRDGGREVADVLRDQLAHRAARLEQVRAALAAGAGDVDAVVAHVHPGLDPALHRAARWSVTAQLRHLGVDLPG